MKKSRYDIDRVVNDRWAVWYLPFENNRSKLGCYKIIDLYPGNRTCRFAFRWKVKGTEKTQEELDKQIIDNTIKFFYKGRGYKGNKFYEQQKNNNNNRRNNYNRKKK